MNMVENNYRYISDYCAHITVKGHLSEIFAQKLLKNVEKHWVNSNATH